jgi:hypothetical protein
MKKRSNKSNKRSQRWAQLNSDGPIPHPRQINGVELRHSITLRYLTNAVTSIGITYQNLLDTILVATTAVAGTDLFQAVRVKAVEIWAAPVQGTLQSGYVEFSGTVAGFVGDHAYHTDTSLGIQPLHIQCKPSKGAAASQWQISSNNVAFILRTPASCVVDVKVEFRSQFINANTACQNALVGATAGIQYLRGLDGLASATTQFTPELSQAVQ